MTLNYSFCPRFATYEDWKWSTYNLHRTAICKNIKTSPKPSAFASFWSHKFHQDLKHDDSILADVSHPHRSGSKESRMPHREGFHTRGVGVIFGGSTSIVQTFRSQRETDLRLGPESKWSVLLDMSVYLVWWVITSPWSIIAKVLRCKVILSETKSHKIRVLWIFSLNRTGRERNMYRRGGDCTVCKLLYNMIYRPYKHSEKTRL